MVRQGEGVGCWQAAAGRVPFLHQRRERAGACGRPGPDREAQELMSRLLIAMAGLPGSGKSTLSRLLAAELGALRWDKDELRQMLFPAGAVPHDSTLNDFCMELLYTAAREGFERGAGVVILDGRPYRKASQRVRLVQVA